MLGAKVSQWSATTSKDAPDERAWLDLCLVSGSSLGRLKIGVICINSVGYYAAKQEGLRRFSPQLHSNKSWFSALALQNTSSQNEACRQGPIVAK